mmetsp:Transcript_31624/g.30929  ORF Transcript_31624/g.30929 Transcript_31624/m.30929 type:complete len:275 (+) Transcript_31624:318-1142(+)
MQVEEKGLKAKSKYGPLIEQVRGNEEQPIELYSFMQKRGSNQRVRISKKNSLLLDPLNRKYNLQASQVSSYVDAEDPFGEFPADYKFGLKNESYNGVYISPEARLPPKKKPKKLGKGQDVRYKVKDLEKVSLMSGWDFFENQVRLKEASDEQFEDKINAHELDEVQKISLKDQSNVILKRQKINLKGDDRQLIYNPRVPTGFKIHSVFFQCLIFPIYQPTDVLRSRNRLSKTQGHQNDLKNSIEKAFTYQEPAKESTCTVIAIEHRFGLYSLVS